MDYISSRLTGVASANELEEEIANLDATKQDILVSQSNIKSINSLSLVGSGNIDLAIPTVVDKTTHIELTVGSTTYKLAKYTES